MLQNLLLLAFLFSSPAILFSSPATLLEDEHSLIPEGQKIFHYPDGRWKMVFHPKENLSTRENFTEESLLETISALKEHFGLNPDNESALKLREIKESLLGKHYHYDQYIKNTQIEGAELVVSVTAGSSPKIYLIYNSLAPERAFATPTNTNKRLLTIEQAYDIAWSDLKVTGSLQGAPQAKIMWHAASSELTKIYQVTLSLSEPKGSWVYQIDAFSGNIIGKKNKILTRMVDRSNVNSLLPLVDRKKAFANFYERKKIIDLANAVPSLYRDGKAKIFDPNPVITLQREELSPDDPDDVFTEAYQQRTLKDLSYSGGTYKLKGPWVQIIDWNSPDTSPSATKDGIWTAERGNNAFNDAMVYYHIDTNQRYMQSLGFTGRKSIIGYPIEIDTDGFDGADNSFYDPQLRRLAFGHGCVPDPEDADVILHEYGHAIQHHIAPYWGDKDADAMGEGFGDYWATSYRLSRPGGDFLPFKMFAWDSGNGACWDGRRTDRTDARYDPESTYSAHGQGYGFVHDELWSTPLVQSLVDLTSKGKSHTSVDQIILQSHFGISSGVSMREMAYATIETAKLLFPSATVYSTTFRRHFAVMGLVPSS